MRRVITLLLSMLVSLAAIAVLFATAELFGELVDPTDTDPTPLETAVLLGQEDRVRELLASGHRYDDTQMGYSAIWFAVRGNHPSIIDALVEYGAPIYGDSRDGYLFVEAMRISRMQSDETNRAKTVPTVNRLLDHGFMPCLDESKGERISELLEIDGSEEGEETLERIVAIERDCGNLQAPGFARQYRWWIAAWLVVAVGVFVVYSAQRPKRGSPDFTGE